MMSMTRLLATTSFISTKRYFPFAKALLVYTKTSTSTSISTNRNRNFSFIFTARNGLSSSLSFSSSSLSPLSISIGNKLSNNNIWGFNNGRNDDAAYPYPNPYATSLSRAGRIVRMTSMSASSESDSDLSDNDDVEEGKTVALELGMEKLYCEWTLDDDRLLYDNRNESIPRLATILGRGLRGVQARLNKINDIDSPAYARLFSNINRKHNDNNNHEHDNDSDDEYNNINDRKLTPAHEIMRRIRWDLNLVAQDFTVFYYDRVEDVVKSSPFDARNDSVSGAEESFVFAIPEHRIMSFNYKERIVWDKNTKLDCVFGSMNGSKETIDVVIQNYDTWKQKKDMTNEANQRRQSDLTHELEELLGKDAIAMLKNISSDLQNTDRTGLTGNIDDDIVEQYVQAVINICRISSTDGAGGDGDTNEQSSSVATTPPPVNLDALDSISNLVALLPDRDLSERILLRIEQTMLPNTTGRRRRQSQLPQRGTDDTPSPSASVQKLPNLDEDDLTEKFVRGSGAGGQKINKTANKVLLIHVPTGLRVECQDTRSLQQNRKIARKRLRSKLDEYLNGSNSKVQVKVAKVIGKKAKAKARNKARRRKKEEVAALDEEDKK